MWEIKSESQKELHYVKFLPKIAGLATSLCNTANNYTMQAILPLFALFTEDKNRINNTGGKILQNFIYFSI